jgi:hypothetical protein
MRYSYFLFYILFILALTGCSILPSKQTSSNLPPVLLAQECGMDGLKCCATSPSCNYGQECCVNPSNPNDNMCADKCEFGKLEQFCNKDNKCDPGMKCLDGRCEICGNEGEECCIGESDSERCSGKVKEGNLVCKENKCLRCGQGGNPCCGGDKCFNDSELLGGQVECRQGICVACGLDNQSLCTKGKKCGENYLENDTFCMACGQYNRPCCVDEKGNTYCDKKLGLKCELGFCN